MWRALINANISCFFTACVAGENNYVENFFTIMFLFLYLKGLMYDPLVLDEVTGPSNLANLLNWILSIIPSYKDLMALVL